jgi:hypothetical protein
VRPKEILLIFVRPAYGFRYAKVFSYLPRQEKRNDVRVPPWIFGSLLGLVVSYLRQGITQKRKSLPLILPTTPITPSQKHPLEPAHARTPLCSGTGWIAPIYQASVSPFPLSVVEDE